MDLKRRECEREAKETEYQEDSIYTIVFTDGTVLLMVYLKRFLVEQWRASVFLILNLILLAILFMSMRPKCCVQSSASEGNVEGVNDGKSKRRPCRCSQEIEEGKESYKEQAWPSTDVHVQNEIKEEEEEETEEVEVRVVGEEVTGLSKEELNERVEAFIVMFRQHLVSDAKEAENFRLQQKTSNMTPKRLKCLVAEA